MALRTRRFLWERFESDYRLGRKGAYRAEKERMAKVLIHRGAIHGWDQTVGNSGDQRIGHSTPVKNPYLAGAWSRPGHGYGGVLQSGPECFAEIVRG